MVLLYFSLLEEKKREVEGSAVVGMFVMLIVVERKTQNGLRFGMTLKKFLITQGISTAGFARAGGFPFETVRKWRQGSRIPRPHSMMKISFLTKRKVGLSDWFGKT